MTLSAAFEKKNILITGGAGFIGSHLVERALTEGRVICIDNLSNATVANIEHLLKHPDFEFLNLDITQPFDLEAYPELEKFKIKFQGIQEIYHLACPTSAKNFDQYKVATLKANSSGMENVLEVAVRHKARFVFGSSSVVYGARRVDKPTFSEDDFGAFDHLSPRGCYDEGKRFAETCVATYNQVYGLDGRIARVFRAYGPRLKLDDGQMLTDFIVSALDGKDLVIYGDETFSTSLTYVSDIVDGMVKLMSAENVPGPVNLGSDHVFRLVDVAQKVIELIGSKSQIRFEAPLPFITALGIPDIRRAKESFGWFPLVSLEEGLTKTIENIVGSRGRIGLV